MVVCDEADDAVRAPLAARELGADARVVEVARERAGATRETRADSRKGPEEHRGDAMPEPRLRGLRAVVQQSREHELVVRAELGEAACGALRVTLITAWHREISPRLQHALDRAQKADPPRSMFTRNDAGTRTSGVRMSKRSRAGTKKMSASRMYGPYCS